MNKEQSRAQRVPDRLAIEKSILLGCAFALFVMSLAGCEKKNGDAIVIGKDYVAAEKQCEALKDERVKITYRVGKYTGTVWDAEIQ